MLFNSYIFLLEEKGIPYAIFINPLNHDVFAALQQIEAYSLFVSWQQEMKTSRHL
jgi:hypothetical protein